ncbi:MAG: tripartite tricarboxylate transporter substrate binding protein, partial [Ramlibacter sp.]|nr:tripartite tricarboxylate transporter substrate binding protein [Ramlibacter sp.]
MLNPRSLGAAALGLAAVFAAGSASAQAFPTKPVRIIVPQTPGGASDALARIVGQKLSERWGQPVVVENKPGAGGNVGTDYVAKSPGDGYTLLMSYVGTQAINGSVYKSLTYEPFKDFAPVATLATVPFALVVNQAFPAKSAGELISYAKAHPGAVNFGSAGNGSLNHLLGEMVNLNQGVKLVHVPYKGAAGALTDTMSGQIQMTFSSLPSVAGHIRGDKLRALAVTGSKRSATFPNLPTFAEAGIAGLELSPWFGLLAPVATPEPVVRKINSDIAEL